MKDSPGQTKKRTTGPSLIYNMFDCPCARAFSVHASAVVESLVVSRAFVYRTLPSFQKLFAVRGVRAHGPGLLEHGIRYNGCPNMVTRIKTAII